MLTLYFFDRLTPDYAAGWTGGTGFTLHPCIRNADTGTINVHPPLNAQGLDRSAQPSPHEAQEHAHTVLTKMARRQIDVRDELPQRPIAGRPAAHAATALGPGADISKDQLAPGLQIMRWTTPLRSPREEMRFFFNVPCCQRRVRLAYRYEGSLAASVLCAPCRIAYQCQAWPDADGGMWVRLTVEEFVHVMATGR
jgi:hypothetical protein